MNTNGYSRPRAGWAGNLHRSLFLVVIIIAASALSACSGHTSKPVKKMKDDVYGFYLGEDKAELFERMKYIASWKEVENPKTGYRGEMYEFSRTPDRSREIDRARVTFLEDKLMEVVVYFTQNNVSKMINLLSRLEDEYGVKATSPGGDIEMAYKTYWIKAPGMSITLRRITKKPETELYIQYMHDSMKELSGKHL